ncbi:MAG: hypothetical protein AAF639_31410 [Chloroflexota bacterium]
MRQSQIVTVPEVATQLPLWLNQTMPSRPPLWLRTTENFEPVAVIIETEAYKQSQKQSSLLYQWQIANLVQWLDRVDST